MRVQCHSHQPDQPCPFQEGSLTKQPTTEGSDSILFCKIPRKTREVLVSSISDWLSLTFITRGSSALASQKCSRAQAAHDPTNKRARSRSAFREALKLLLSDGDGHALKYTLLNAHYIPGRDGTQNAARRPGSGGRPRGCWFEEQGGACTRIQRGVYPLQPPCLSVCERERGTTQAIGQQHTSPLRVCLFVRRVLNCTFIDRPEGRVPHLAGV